MSGLDTRMEIWFALVSGVPGADGFRCDRENRDTIQTLVIGDPG